jgi:hypothetical protein
MVMSFMAVYLAVGVGVFAWWNWLYQQGLRNLFQDFTRSSAIAIVGLLAVVLILFWPLLLVAWWQSQTSEFQQHYQEIEKLRQMENYEEVLEVLRSHR